MVLDQMTSRHLSQQQTMMTTTLHLTQKKMTPLVTMIHLTQKMAVIRQMIASQLQKKAVIPNLNQPIRKILIV
ncbi:MAG: hypothetical protein Tsb0027_15460 [Wenzhouxiangellaceae bacterium]